MPNPVLPRPETIGASALGQPILVYRHGITSAPVRLLFLCGQHGDEAAIQRAAQRFSQSLLLSQDLLGNLLQVAIIISANPDGLARGTRRNAQDIDLNRDHLRLQAPETRTIHRFVAQWQPHLIVDMHNFPSRRRHLLQRGLRLAWDLCLDFPANPAAPIRDGHPLFTSLEQTIANALTAAGYRYGRYTLINPNGSSRHGTPQLLDARNVLALRYAAPVVLLEARNPSSRNSPHDRRHIRRATLIACQELLRWASAHADSLLAPPPTRTRIPLRFRRRPAPQPLPLPCVQLATGQTVFVPCSPYRPRVEGRRSISLPLAYAVPATENATLNLLHRHGISPFPHCPIPGFKLFPVTTATGPFLALLLEAESRFGLYRRNPNRNPVRRITHPISEVRS